MKLNFDPLRLEHQTILKSIVGAREYFRGRILDVGCGEKPYRELVGADPAGYVGADHDALPPKTPDVCTDVLRLPFRDGSFDTVFSTQVLEHVRDPFTMYSEMTRVLRPGGHLIVTAPQSWPLHEEPYDFFRYTRYAFEEFARRNSLEVVRLSERGGGMMALGQIFAGILEERCRRSRPSRILMKLAVFPVLVCSEILDFIFYYPKFTLGYLFVGRKTPGEGDGR